MPHTAKAYDLPCAPADRFTPEPQPVAIKATIYFAGQRLACFLEHIALWHDERGAVTKVEWRPLRGHPVDLDHLTPPLIAAVKTRAIFDVATIDAELAQYGDARPD